MSTITDLIPALADKTKQKKLAWDIGTDNEVWVRIGNNIVEIRNTIFETDEDFTISVRNKDGAVVDREVIYKAERYFDIVSEMWTEARRQARRADESIDQILYQLEKL